MQIARLGLLGLSLFSGLQFAQDFDIVIAGAKVIDGSGSPWFYADVAIKGDTIAGIGPMRIDRGGADRRARSGGGARLHRHPFARPARHLRRAHR